MAGPPCMSGDGNPAVFVGTMLQSGDAVALCDECMVPWLAAVLHTMTDIDPAPFLLAVSDDPTLAAAVDGDQPPLDDSERGHPPTAAALNRAAGHGSNGSADHGTGDDPDTAPAKTPRARKATKTASGSDATDTPAA